LASELLRLCWLSLLSVAWLTVLVNDGCLAGYPACQNKLDVCVAMLD